MAARKDTTPAQIIQRLRDHPRFLALLERYRDDVEY
jgi:hypothetical protein